MSDQLIPSAGASFQQSGQFDWVSLSRSVVQISVGTLARLSRAGVDAYTVQVGKALCWNLELSAKVQDNLVEEIKNLKCAKLCDNLLWFGFGIKQFVADLAETEQGLALVALCSALTINYDVFYAAQVLRQLCLQAKAPQQFMPSLQQWKALVRLCSGILMDSPFQLLLNGLQRLVRGSKPIVGQKAMEPASIAKGLSNLALLSKGSTVHLSFSGGEDCCWLASFAKLVLSLDVAIYDAIGSLVYLSQDQRSEAPRVTFNLDVKASNTVLSAQKTSLVPRGQSLIKLEARDGSASNLSSFSTWATILHDTFGSAVDILLGDPCGEDFAVFLCDMPALEWLTQRGIDVFDGADQREPPPPPDSARMESPMQSAKRLLPELSLLQSQACWQKRKRHRALKESLTNIRTHCGTDKTKTSGQGSLYAKHAEHCHTDPCLVHLARSICAYLRLLFTLNIGDHVMPSMRGLRHLYERNSSLGRLSQRTNRVRDESIHQVYETFTGDATTHSKPAELKAWTGNGLCIFSCFLEDPTGPLYKTQRFAAVRGYIAYEDRWYESLSDMRTERSPGKDDPENQFRVVTKSRAITAQPVVEETDDERTLRLGYKIRCSQLQFDNRWLILGDLVSALLKGDIATLVSCSGQHEIRYDVDKDVRYAVEQGLLRWAQQYGFVLSYFLRRMNGTSGMYFGEGPALYTTYIHYKNSRQVGLFRCPGCLDCLLDRFNDATEIYRLSPDRKGKVHLYGLKETPITVQWERVSPQSPSPRPEMEPTSPKPGDDSNSPLQERDP
jgi:hypothetical protein